MLRLGVLLLFLTNLLTLAWGQGWLTAWGFGPMSQSEPQRLAQQVNPQALVLLGVGEAANRPPAQSAASEEAAICLQSPLLDAREADALRVLLPKTLPQGSWSLTVQPGTDRWLIYLGKFDNANDLAKKRAQLSALGVKFFPLANPALAPGMSLGDYPDAPTAEAALEALKLKGVRTARVLQDTPPNALHLLRLPVLSTTLQELLPPIQSMLAGKPLRPCPTEPAV